MIAALKTLALTSTLIVLSATAIQAQAQTQAKAQLGNSTSTTEPAQTTAPPAPVFSDYKGIKIGLAVNEVRTNLEKYLKSKGDGQDFLVVSENESAQIFYDPQGKVRAVSIDYLAKNGNAPTPAQVLGKEIQPRADGSVYALERYPELGYWISYNRTSGDNPLVTITMQAIQ